MIIVNRAMKKPIQTPETPIALIMASSVKNDDIAKNMPLPNPPIAPICGCSEI